MDDSQEKQAAEYANKFTDALGDANLTTEQVLYLAGRIVIEVSINAFEDEEHARSFIDAIKSQTLDIMIKGEYIEGES